MTQTIKTTYIKSPLNYVGGKYKLLPQIMPLIPADITMFIDLFGGGFNVGSNVNAKQIIYNDIESHVVELLSALYKNDHVYVNNEICRITEEYGLNRADIHGDKSLYVDYFKERYYKLRTDYNRNPDWKKFYTLVTCSFSNQIRFNSRGEFNMPYGERYYNQSLQEKLCDFIKAIYDKNIGFYNEDFRKLYIDRGSFVYCDPPYFNSNAAYNERDGWTEKDEQDLHDLLDEWNNRGVRWALSANLKYSNPHLNEWKDKYNVHYLNGDYNNCNYQKKDKSKDIEVLITNYRQVCSS